MLCILWMLIFAVSQEAILQQTASASQSGQLFEPVYISAQARDVVYDSTTNRLFLAVYDHNEIWSLDPDSYTIQSRYPTGAGPNNLAISNDGQFLAISNRLENSVTIYNLPGMTNAGTIRVSEGPVRVRPNQSSGFIVTSMYADKIDFLSTDSMSCERSVLSPTSVPVDAVLLPGERLAVLGRASGELYIQESKNTSSWHNIALVGEPLALFPIGQEYLLVATRSGLWQFDIQHYTRINGLNIPLTDAIFDGQRIYILHESIINTLDTDLNLRESYKVNGEAQLLAGVSGHIHALAPGNHKIYTAKHVHLTNDGHDRPLLEELSQPFVQHPISNQPESSSGDIIIEEAQPVRNEENNTGWDSSNSSHNTEILPVASSSEQEGNGEVSLTGAAPINDVVAPVEDTLNMQDAEEETPARRQTTSQIQKYPMQTGGIRAPHSARPSPTPMRELSRKTILDALRQPTQFGSPEAGFQAPDWTDPLRNFEADFMEQDIASGDIYLEGNVRLRLGNMYFESDDFDYKEWAGLIQATGNIRLEQEASYLTADHFTYQLPAEEAIPHRYPFRPPLDDDTMAKQRLTMGRILAHNVLIVEPTREMKAEDIDYDFIAERGFLKNTTGRAGIYYYAADELHIHGPECFEAKDVWVTTCDHEHPHYRIRLSQARFENGVISEGTNARLQLGRFDTPLYLPRYRAAGVGGQTWNMDFDSGRRADIGYFINVGQRLEFSPDFSAGPRIFATQKEGVGVGVDFNYDFMQSPASRLYRTQGEFNSLHTTEDRGYLHYYHRYEYDNDLVFRLQAEQWSDRDFYKDFYFDAYRNRTAPRTFANLTYRQPSYIATGTTRLNTHNWMRQTESIPSAGYHLLERSLAENLYFSLDSQLGYYDRKPGGSDALRTSSQARLTYNMTPLDGISITPFAELDATWYSQQRISDDSYGRVSPLIGITTQSRLHKTYAGAWGFSGFKHVVLPSLTYSYRPDTNWKLHETHRFDSIDSNFGRSRIETRLDNVFYGKDAETGDIWQVGRLSLFQGNDLASEATKSEDYEIEFDLRPRPWWGFQLVSERHITTSHIGRPVLENLRMRVLDLYEDRVGRPFDSDAAFYAGMGNYSRVLAQFYYDEMSPESPVSGRLGFAYTATQSRKYNREILYGLGYRLGENWGLAFEHIYDMDGGNLRTQTYEVRRSLHCWETAIRFRDRESGFDIDLTFYIKAFPGSRLKF